MQKILLTILFGSVVGVGCACDVCGYVSSGFNSNLSTLKARHFVGLNYAARSFSSRHETLFESETASHSYERYNSLTLLGQYSPIKFIQFNASLPYQILNQFEDEHSVSNSGVGDAQLTANFALNVSKTDSAKYAARILIGGGIKAPTGRNEFRASDPFLIPSMQLGSGSWDLLASVSAIQQLNNWGLRTEALYRFNRANKSGYQFGNRFLSSFGLYRKIYFGADKKWMLQNSVGMQFDLAQQDYNNVFRADIREYSGGYFLDALINADLYFKNTVLGVTYFTPIHQYYAQGLVNAKPGLNIKLQYIFKSN